MKTNKFKQTKKSKSKLSKAEEHLRKVRLIKAYAPLCGKNYQRLAELTGLNYSNVFKILNTEKYKDIREAFDKSERIDHQTEMWHTKTLKLKNAIPQCDGSYKHLSGLTDIPVVTVKTYINDPRNGLLKIELDERRKTVKEEKEKIFNELLTGAIKKFGSDIARISEHVGHEVTYTYKLIKGSESTEVRKLITTARDKQKEKISSPPIPDSETYDPNFEIDSRAESFLPHQIDFAYSLPDVKKHPALIGGFGSGKTMSIPIRWLKLIEYRKQQNKKCDLMVLEPTNEMIRDIIVPTFDDFFAQFGIPVKYFSQRQNYTIQYKGEKHSCLLRSAAQPRSLTGKNLSDIIIDEFDRIPYHKQKRVWRECISRIRKTQHGTCAVVTTPEGYKYTHELWVEKKHKAFLYVKAKTQNNIYLPPDYIENLIEQYDSKLAKQYLEGEFVNIESDLVYYCFDRNTNVIADAEIPERESNTLIISFDFNVNPMCAVEIIMNGKTRYQVFEYKISNSNTKDLCETIIESLHKRYENAYDLHLTITGDASGGARSSTGENSDFEIIRKCFHDAGFLNAYLYPLTTNPHVRERVNFINSILEKRQFLIAETCKHSVKDRELVSWKKGSGKFIIDKSERNATHLSDAADYGLWLSRLLLNKDTNSKGYVYYPHTSKYN